MLNRIPGFLYYPAILLGPLLLLQCATPTQPTGGPPDRTPPQLVETRPATGTTSFDGDRIRFEFDKYIDRNSFEQAFRIEPDLLIDYDVSWSRRTATVRFDEPLPDTTTIIFTLGTDLRDTRGNSITSPLQLALSTGPEIDDGRITAKVRDAVTGEGLMGERVVLYRHPADLSLPANYVGEADSAGVVRFNYLREGSYKAFWLDDRNRNRRWDRQREAAQPFRTDTLELDPGGELDAGTVFVMKMDTIPPVLLAVGMLSEVRLRLRFSESVQFLEGAGITVFHEDGNPATDAVPLYVDRDNSNVMLAEALNPLPDGQSYRLELRGVSDLGGNEAEIDVDLFPGSDEPDTTYARYVSHDTRHGIRPDEPIIVRYAKLLDDTPQVLDSLVVVESESTFQPWEPAVTVDNLLMVYPDGEWQRGEDYEIRVWDEEQMDRRSIIPNIHFDNQLGGLEVLFDDPPADTARFRLSLTDEQGFEAADTIFTDTVELTDLPPGSYILQAYEIREGHRRWDAGQVDPFRPPARFFIQKDVPVEQGMTGQVYISWP
ncbi:Ig-like domain-containing protein [Balneolales bacterium ANBcel1]|nr:Ig-like domain-containing protein [Balneolales bacterium ANBcel1]